MYVVGDIFKIDHKEYKVRFVNKTELYWLEPVLSRDKDFCFTGGLNKICRLEELIKSEYLNVCY